MNREIIATGRTVDEALDKAYEQLGVDRDAAQFEIINLPKKGFLGLGASMAKVRVFIEVSKAQCAVNYLQSIFQQMGLENVQIDVTESENCANIALSGDGLGVLIGRRGETLDALQYLSGLVANRLEGDYYRIVVDSGNYREKREKTLENLAKKLSAQVIRTGRSMTLEPMNPYERRVIHATIQGIDGVNSSSIGEEPSRRVVISSTNPAKRSYNRERSAEGGDRGDRGRDRGGRGGRNDRGGRGGYEKRPPREKYVPQDVTPNRTKVEVEDDGKPLYSKIELD
ncbi:MAG: protein jag [Oscillospiraceae bacterium]|nr:protein jag [Oscillospiraceae bacterium]